MNATIINNTNDEHQDTIFFNEKRQQAITNYKAGKTTFTRVGCGYYYAANEHGICEIFHDNNEWVADFYPYSEYTGIGIDFKPSDRDEFDTLTEAREYINSWRFNETS